MFSHKLSPSKGWNTENNKIRTIVCNENGKDFMTDRSYANVHYSKSYDASPIKEHFGVFSWQTAYHQIVITVIARTAQAAWWDSARKICTSNYWYLDVIRSDQMRSDEISCEQMQHRKERYAMKCRSYSRSVTMNKHYFYYGCYPGETFSNVMIRTGSNVMYYRCRPVLCI